MPCRMLQWPTIGNPWPEIPRQKLAGSLPLHCRCQLAIRSNLGETKSCTTLFVGQMVHFCAMSIKSPPPFSEYRVLCRRAAFEG